MNKEYILFKVKQRLEELKSKYYEYVNSPSKSNVTKRALVKRDIQILILIEQLCATSQAVYIEDDDAIDGFMKLVEPRRFNKQ